jgi:hypothetical protein
MTRHSERGNVFLAIFGAVALVGVLGASVMTFMKGPLATSVKLTKINTAENQMTIGAQVAVMATASQPGGGDCDSDNFVEPMEWRAATTEPIPVNGGLIPLSLGISKKDPWGTEYGYCVWNHGATTTGAGCDANMLEGTNSTAYPVVALISAGPDKIFTTTCLDFATADDNSDGDLDDAGDSPLVAKAAATDDDVIFTYTYQEATAASGGLWSLKTGDPNTAVINKNIEATGTANLQGGVLLPDTSLVTCDATTAGVMAMNGNAIEICDGAGNWTAITGGVAGGGLVLSPNVSSGMDVSGGCGNPTCYSSNVTFTLTNNLSPAAASVALATSLSNTTNFEFVSDGCNGLSLASGAACQMVVRAKASGNVSYSGSLQVLGNNSPLAMLDGTGSGFAGCNTGGMAPGGYYVACGVGGYDLVVTPSGCTGTSTNPVCAGGVDTHTGQASLAGYFDIASSLLSTSGGQNTANAVSYVGGTISFPAASHCNSLVYQGHSDWFLPSSDEMMSYAYPNRAILNFASNHYWTSSSGPVTEIVNQGNNWMRRIHMGTGANPGTTDYWNVLGTNNHLIRCMRWEPTRSFTANVDTTPAVVSFTPSYGGPAEQRTSNSVTISRISGPVTISVSGAGSPEYSINGGAYTSAAGTVANGDQVTLRATSPALGLENVVSVTIGSSNFNWQVRTPGNNTIRVFTTSTTTNGALGGAGGADAFCTARATAAGLPGAWTAVVGTGATGDFSLSSRLPWNWKTLKNLNGVGSTVAVSLADFLDGTISAPMNYTESGGVAATSTIWTGMLTTGATQGNCSSWGSSAGSGNYFGDSSATSGGNYFSVNSGNCGGTYRLLCMESNAAGVDTDPNAVGIQPQVVFASGATGTSNTVTITGVTDEVPVAITPSAGTANIIKDGLSVGATTTMAGLNQTLSFTLTAPTVLGTRNTATIDIGPDSYTWWVGYADSAREAKAFITSTTYGGGMGGLSSADTICSTAAASSSYGLSSNWIAFLSDSNADAANRIPWNWGVLKTVTGITIVDEGYNDLLDGSVDNALNISELGTTVNSFTWTGSNSNGLRLGSVLYATNHSYGFCWDWSLSSNSYYGVQIGLSSSTGLWANASPTNAYCGSGYPIYCIEDVDSAVADTTPNAFNIPYPVQVPTSSRQTSSVVLISGMSSGATQTLSVTATGGDPKFKVNGGAEVTSASVTNGDSIEFLMDAPAVGNSNNRMTITAGTMTSYWRVWTGDTTGTAVKRVFVTKPITPGIDNNRGGVTGADTVCTSKATAAGLGGTWKAIASGQNETEFAVNRIGYNWSTLRRVDGVDVVLAGNIWNTAVLPLLNPISIGEDTTTVVTTTYVKTGTDRYGKGYLVSHVNSNCGNWASSATTSTYALYNGTSSTTAYQWIENGSASPAPSYGGGDCRYLNHLYCIEQ